MEITIDTSNSAAINWDASGDDRIIQNVINLLNTYKYEVAYDRTLGLAGKFIDKSTEDAIALATAEIYDLISEKEPRAAVKNVTYIGTDDNGNMNFEVVIDIGG